MPILGVVASSRLTSSSSYESIASSVVSGVSSVSFSSIPQTYQHLELRWSTVGSTGGAGLFLRFNEDTSGNYTRNVIFGVSGSGVTTSTGVGSSAGASSFYVTVWMDGLNDSFSDAALINVYDYSSTSKYKTAWGQVGQTRSASRNEHNVTGGSWLNNSAVTSISLTPSSGTITGTFSLYGIKG